MMKDMRIAPHFLYTQHSLATFDSCPLKFKKRYMENLKWDSFPDENIKKRLELGNNFHLLAYRYFMGIDVLPEGALDEFPEIGTWVGNLKRCFEKKPGSLYYPEYKIRMIDSEIKLEANFDLLIVKDGSIEIWDWKTHDESSKTPKHALERRLRESLQTMVYLFVLKEQSRLVTGRNVAAPNISMHYWQPEPIQTITDIQYSDELHGKFKEILTNKIHNILQYEYKNFNRELYSKHCRFCEFNWYCNNERVDFSAMYESDEFMDEINWDDIGEIY